jgi:hypothetical protein
MVKRTSNNREGLNQLLEAQQESLGELRTIKELLQLKKDLQGVTSAESAQSGPAFVEQKKLLDTMQSMARTTEQLMRVQAMQQKAQDELVKTAKEQYKGSRRYWKLQEDFEKDWRKEARDISEMAKGMKTFKTLGEKFTDKKEGIKEKFGIENGGLKKTVLGALNVGGIFNKTLERDKFVEQQRALGSTSSTKDLKKDFEGANNAAKLTQKTEAAIARQKQTAGVDDEEYLRTVSPEFAKLLEKRQQNADEYGKYQRATDIKSPTPVTRLDSAQGMNVFNKPITPTQTAAEAAQNAETAEESKKMEQDQTDYLKIIAENTVPDKNAKTKRTEEKKPEGGGLLGTILAAAGGFLSGMLGSMFSMLSKGLMAAFRALLSPGVILKALGKVFAIGMVVGALFEGIMDGFDEFSKSGSIGKAIIAGLAGVLDFITFGLFDKEKIKEVIGDFSKWTYDHLIKPFTDFLGGIKDKFLEFFGFQKTTTEEHVKQTTASNTAASKDFAADSKQPVKPRPQDPLKAQVWDSKYASGWNPDGSAKNATAPASKTGKETMDYSYDNFITKNPTTTLTREQFNAKKSTGVNPTPVAATPVAATPAGKQGVWRDAPDQGKGSAEWWKKYQEARSDGMSVKDAKAAANKAVASSPAASTKAEPSMRVGKFQGDNPDAPNYDADLAQFKDDTAPLRDKTIPTKTTFNGNVVSDGKPTPVKLGDKLGPNWTAALKDYETGTPVDKYESTYPGIKAKFKELAKNSKPRTDNFQSIESHEQVLITRAMAAIKDGKGKATAVAPQPATVAAQVDQPVKNPEQPTNVFNKPVATPKAGGTMIAGEPWSAGQELSKGQLAEISAGIASGKVYSNRLINQYYTQSGTAEQKASLKVKVTPQGGEDFLSKAQPIPPQTASQVEAKSAENASAKDAPVAANKTNVVNAPVTTNNNTTQVSIRPPIRNEESSNSRYAASRFAF